MNKTLAELLSDDSHRNRALHTLMDICRSGAQEVYCVCVGAGDAFINRYWPKLRERVNRQTLRLLVADEKPLEKFVPEIPMGSGGEGLDEKAERIRNLYEEFKDDVKRQKTKQKIKYVNINNPSDHGWYDHLKADIVFVLVPDYNHLKVAKEWLGRSTLILVEKPYSQDPIEIAVFHEVMDKMMERAGGDVRLAG